MNGWEVLIWCAVAGFGVLQFMKVVSNHIWVTETMLDRLEDQEREAFSKRSAPADEEPVTGVLRAKLG